MQMFRTQTLRNLVTLCVTHCLRATFAVLRFSFLQMRYTPPARVPPLADPYFQQISPSSLQIKNLASVLVPVTTSTMTRFILIESLKVFRS